MNGNLKALYCIFRPKMDTHIKSIQSSMNKIDSKYDDELSEIITTTQAQLVRYDRIVNFRGWFLEDIQKIIDELRKLDENWKVIVSQVNEKSNSSD